MISAAQWTHVAGEGLYFLSRVSILTRDIDVGILSVRPSVTFRYWMKTAEHIVIAFSPYGSPIILVLSASNIFTKFRRGHPLRGS